MCRNRAALGGRVERVLPEVAHQAAEGALPVGEQQRVTAPERTIGAGLVFDKAAVRLSGGMVVFRATSRQNPAGALSGRVGVERKREHRLV